MKTMDLDLHDMEYGKIGFLEDQREGVSKNENMFS